LKLWPLQDGILEADKFVSGDIDDRRCGLHGKGATEAEEACIISVGGQPQGPSFSRAEGLAAGKIAE
jgi:hypothetical protein